MLAFITRHLPELATGWRNTLALVAVAAVASMAIGVVVAVLRLAPLPYVPALARAQVELFRNTPLLVQMAFAYYALPSAGLRLSPFQAAGAALSVYTGAYVTETLRAGVASVGRGQIEAARSLGMGYPSVMRFVVLPQAARTVVPPLGTLLIAMVKNSAIAAAIAYPELLYASEILNARTFRTFDVFTATAAGFLMITLPLSYAVSKVERRLAIRR